MCYLQIFDGVVVMATCVIYVCLTVVISKHLLAYSLSYIIVLRLWRLGRLYNGLYHGRRLLKTFVGVQLPRAGFNWWEAWGPVYLNGTERLQQLYD